MSKKFTVSPYNLGPARNLYQIFGANPLVWVIPFCNFKPHEGIVFPYDSVKLIKGSKEYDQWMRK